MRIRNRFFSSLLVLSFSAIGLAQTTNRSQNPILQPGEGLTMSKKDVESIRNDGQDKKAKTTDVYVCAISFSPVDSTMYISNIQKIEQVVVKNKWFIDNRQALEQEFDDYVKDKAGDLQYSSLFFSEKEKRVLKQRERIIRKNNKKKRFNMRYTGADFKF